MKADMKGKIRARMEQKEIEDGVFWLAVVSVWVVIFGPRGQGFTWFGVPALLLALGTVLLLAALKVQEERNNHEDGS